MNCRSGSEPVSHVVLSNSDTVSPTGSTFENTTLISTKFLRSIQKHWFYLSTVAHWLVIQWGSETTLAYWLADTVAYLLWYMYNSSMNYWLILYRWHYPSYMVRTCYCTNYFNVLLLLFILYQRLFFPFFSSLNCARDRSICTWMRNFWLAYCSGSAKRLW